MKQYVDVLANWEKTGKLVPVALQLDGVRYKVERVLAAQPLESLKSSPGTGFRYTVQICGQRSYLYYGDADKLWWVDVPGQG